MPELPRTNNSGDLFVHHDDDRPAIVDLTGESARTVSYAALNAGCRAVARGLRRHGLGPGDRVAIVAGNAPAFYEVFFGAMRAGCVPMQINTQLADDTVETLLAEAAPKLVFADPANAARLNASRPIIELTRESYGTFLDPGPFDTVRPDPGDMAFIPYSSGTTGLPKGILLSHANAMWALKQLAGFIAQAGGKPERVIVAHPLYHKNAMLASKSTFLGGGTVVLQRKFVEEDYLAAVEKYAVTRLRTVPTMMARLVARDDLLARFDLSSVKAVQMGSGPIAEKLYDTVQAKFPQARMRLGYGLTEAGPMQFGPHPDGQPTPRMSIGFPLKDGEVRLVDGVDDDEGRLLIRNPGVMKGYLNRPEDTAAKLLDDGWLDSGDILRRDADGFYYFVGRADDMFVVGGNNVYPSAVENVLLKHPDIQEACVVAVDDLVRGQAPHAFVVARRGSELGEDAIKRFFLDRAPAYQHPRRVHFLDALPLHGTNKVDTRLLKARASQAAAKD